MATTKEKKVKLLADLNEKIEKSKAIIFAQYDGTKVSDMKDLRKKLREENIALRVTKNTLLKKALEENGYKIDEEILSKPLTVAFDEKDEVAPAKIISQKTKEVETLNILGAIVNGEFFNASKVASLAKMPSREELYAKLVGTVNAPVSGFVNVLAGNLRGLVNVLRARSEKLEESK